MRCPLPVNGSVSDIGALEPLNSVLRYPNLKIIDGHK
jgi:hypothetical protein